MAPAVTPNDDVAVVFPPLPLKDWEPTKDTLHLYLQIIGKIRLKQMPHQNHWWHVTLYLTARGLTTGPIPYRFYTFQIDFDFISHQLIIETSLGTTETITLHNGLSVAQFYTSVFSALTALGIKVAILAKPYDNKCATPFADDHEHATYEPEQVTRYWRILAVIDGIMKEFSGRFYGKTCPVQLYWHHFDLVVTRFSGKALPIRPEASIVEKEAYSHEVISFGFWPGDEQVRFPAFYSYTFPSPHGLDEEPLLPREAAWVDSNGSPMALLKYDDMRTADNPKQVLLDFMESAYHAGASLAGWPVTELRSKPLEEHEV
ncbi:DUF5996 family protein [Pontibacter vulgaris]|uniref:DUF5996 family protein n=1 Tax=Pontibacter vulgaris TaxID=2905679 RepID=UPI001FA6C212|nr:DUF5996 family protein [Pontibacter vulgaris]